MTECVAIEVYVARNGKSPFLKWLDGLRDRQMRARIRVKLDRVRLGNFGDCQALGGGLYELRVHYGPGYRVYFGRVGLLLILLLCGGDKRSQSNDIRQARGYLADYRSQS